MKYRSVCQQKIINVTRKIKDIYLILILLVFDFITKLHDFYNKKQI